MFEQIHHIKPRSEGGSDDPANLLHCTIEEHAKLHLQLALKNLEKDNFEGYCKNIRSASLIAFGQGKKYINALFETYGIDGGNDLSNEIIELQEKIKEQTQRIPPYKNKASYEFHKYLEELKCN